MQETLNQLGIDWIKLMAQTINFGIILFVLWKWAYKPVLAILEERRRRIDESMTNAEKIKAELASTEQARLAVLNEANGQALRLIEEARQAAARVQEQETQKAIAQAEQIIAKAREATEVDRARMLAELKRDVGMLVVKTTAAVTGKVLTPADQEKLAEETRRQLAV